jgi:hypothetical protein
VAPEVRGPALTRVVVFVAVVSMTFNMPMPAAEASIPMLQPEKSNP